MYYIVATKTYLVHQIILYHSSDEIVGQAVKSSYSIRSLDIKEFAVRTQVSEFSNEFTEIFMDNSMGVVKQDYYTFNNAKRLGVFNAEKDFTYMGLNSYPAVNGAMLKDGNRYYGFVSSCSALFNAVSKNQFEIVLSRSTEHYDEKAIVEPLIDNNFDTYEQFLFLSDNIHQYEQSRLRFNQVLNNKIKINIVKNKVEVQSKVYSLFNSDQISDINGELDFVDLNVIDNTSLMIKLKNTRSHAVLTKSEYFKDAQTLNFLELYHKQKPYQYTEQKYSARPLLDYKSDYLDT